MSKLHVILGTDILKKQVRDFIKILLLKMDFFLHDTSMGQRKILSPRRESNPWPPRYRLGALTN